MNEKTLSFLTCCASGTLLLAAVLIAAQRDALKKQAVERGYAEWVVSSSGDARWQWKE